MFHHSSKCGEVSSFFVKDKRQLDMVQTPTGKSACHHITVQYNLKAPIQLTTCHSLI